jgi:hypothetical protein
VNTGYLSYLPASAKYMFIAMMVVGTLAVIYVMLFNSGRTAPKFQNKGMLSKYLDSRFREVNSPT